MMANPEMSSTQEQGLAAVPPQGRPAEAPEGAATVSAAAQVAKAAKAAPPAGFDEADTYDREPKRLPLRRRAWQEDLVVLFAVTVVFGVVTYLLVRARHTRVVVVQAIVTALILTAAVTSAATGDPKPTAVDTPTIGTPGHPG